jgi:hypothetical protein
VTATAKTGLGWDWSGDPDHLAMWAALVLFLASGDAGALLTLVTGGYLITPSVPGTHAQPAVAQAQANLVGRTSTGGAVPATAQPAVAQAAAPNPTGSIGTYIQAIVDQAGNTITDEGSGPVLDETGAGFTSASPRPGVAVAVATARRVTVSAVGATRVAQLVGFDVERGGWTAANNTIGPGDSHRMFYSGALPASFDADGTPSNITIIASYKTQMTQTAIQTYLATLPATRQLILIYHHEPEGDYTLGSTFVSEFKTQSDRIRAAVASLGITNVRIAMCAAGYPYRAAGTADVLAGNYLRGLGAISPTSGQPYVDMFTKDVYQGTAGTGGFDWPSQGLKNYVQFQNWMTLATDAAVVGVVKPLGITEYGITVGPGLTNADRNQRIQDDDTYLTAAFTVGGPSAVSAYPLQMLCYWWQSIDVNAAKFTDSATIATWKAIETTGTGGTGGTGGGVGTYNDTYTATYPNGAPATDAYARPAAASGTVLGPVPKVAPVAGAAAAAAGIVNPLASVPGNTTAPAQYAAAVAAAPAARAGAAARAGVSAAAGTAVNPVVATPGNTTANAGYAAAAATAAGAAVVRVAPLIRGRLAGNNGSTTGTTISPSLSTGWTLAAPQSGDIVFIAGFAGFPSGSTWSQTSGTGTWTFRNAGLNNTGGNFNTFCAYRLFDGTETDPVFTYGGSAGTRAWALIAVTPTPGNTIDIDSWSTDLAVTTPANSFTPDSANVTTGTVVASVILTAARAAANASAAITPTPPSGWAGTLSGADYSGYSGGTNSRATLAHTCSKLGPMTGTVAPGSESLSSAQTLGATIFHVLLHE